VRDTTATCRSEELVEKWLSPARQLALEHIIHGPKILKVICAAAVLHGVSLAAEPETARWKYSADCLRPFWLGSTMVAESVLFIKDDETEAARASVLFPVEQVVAVQSSAGDITYEEGRDYLWKKGSREFVLPPNSRITSRTPMDLRRPNKTQQFELTHRDGHGEILFGAKLEYQGMQTSITYTHAPNLWSTTVPKYDPTCLPHTLEKLRNKQPLLIVVIGDSISTGCNASGWAKASPFQPPYPELLRQHLEAYYSDRVDLRNLSVGGTDTSWALTMVDQIVEPKPDLVIIAFGMNDAASRPANEYKANVDAVINKIRKQSPNTEFILVASMIGNRDWITLKQELFPQYRDALEELRKPGIAVANVTSIWAGILDLKKDWDQTGNGVNHPNDFGHRIYAQVLSALLGPSD
jgi:acyl-CoA thioesterase-1